MNGTIQGVQHAVYWEDMIRTGRLAAATSAVSVTYLSDTIYSARPAAAWGDMMTVTHLGAATSVVLAACLWDTT